MGSNRRLRTSCFSLPALEQLLLFLAFNILSCLVLSCQQEALSSVIRRRMFVAFPLSLSAFGLASTVFS